MNTSRWRGLVAVYGGLLVAAGCGDAGAGEVAQEESGRVQVVLTSSALSAADIWRVGTHVSSESWTRAFDQELVQDGTQWKGTIEAIPVGDDWVFRGDAFDFNGQLAYQGQVAPVTIEADRTAFVQLNLDQVPAAVPFQNSSPRIQALTASAIDVQPTDIITLGALAVDPDGDSLTYEWSSDAGSFNTTFGNRVQYTTPRTQGVYPVQLQVYDHKGLTATAELQINVLTTLQEGSAEVTVTVNSFPLVNDVWVKPSPIAVGEEVSLGVGAVDPDGDALSYAWSSTCEGTFDATDVEFPYFTLTTLPESGSCQFTVLVEDGRGGSNFGTIDVLAGSNPDVVVGPPPGTPLTAAGEAYGHNGVCESGWNECGDAQTCALWACLANGYSELVSHGREGFAWEFTSVNLLLGNWQNGVFFGWSTTDCGLMAVTDIVCR